ncbi:hypothetical protein [Streptomyces boncukensis]|uniref:Lipoprotein n=1 Tax=Streptomyces boncukensis TaxID=2711219 RepID=A0A6G4XAI8_9ACTN|nr:hypothetical protein [Streptomyces boncukensis]NGO73857.1 hypothetical protein [Streptomyces boncukensis]
MPISRQVVASLLCVATTVVAAGCSENKLSTPEAFCQIPVAKDSLSPLLPKEGNLKQKRSPITEPGLKREGALCNIQVDSQRILYASVLHYSEKPEPMNWKAAASPYNHAARRKVSFPGTAMIAPGNATIRAKCDSTSEYMQFVLDLNGERVNDSPTGYKKLQKFANDFVPNATKKYGCTS